MEPIYPNPTKEQLQHVDRYLSLSDIRETLPELFKILPVMNSKRSEDAEEDDDEGEDTYMIVSETSKMAQLWLREAWVPVFPGHMLVYYEYTGFTNVTLVLVTENDTVSWIG